MRPRYLFLLSLLVLVTSFNLPCCSVAAAETATWQAGTARVNVTPEKYIWMAGYGGRNRPADGKLTDLWAKALVLVDADGDRAVLVTLDLIGLSREFSQSVCSRLKERHGLERQQIAFCCSHTHTGPALVRNLSPLHYLIVDKEQQDLIQEYTTTLEDRVVEVVGQALSKTAPVRLSWGSGTATFAVNRRNNPSNQVPQLRAEGKLKGPQDHDVPVLAVRDAAGELRAVVFGYACHATVLSFYQWSGDYPGFAQIEFEKSHPGCLAMFWAGCGADQNPLPRRTVELAMEYGTRLAKAADEVLAKEMQVVEADLKTHFREIDLPLAELPSREQIEQDAKSENKYTAARAKMLLARIDGGQPLSQTYPYPVETWQLGDKVQFVTLGGEVVVDFALRLKSELRGTGTWVAGFSNDVMAYIASRRVLKEGGYEGGGAMVYYGLPTVWAPESEDMIIDEVHRQLSP
ncbi:MAG: neutral/alkaline non-lysosomal ceramidase N-terminal domain-containing protein [Pirellulaceae bacterium]|nr:neutral/alkaline non-lysosomal ceramidase N-terminal domain-containing protein [Pirellulaceae bacterium]